jgi:DNA-binding NarL/FixJ family response regulator
MIVLTTYSGDVQVVRALKAGARGFLLSRNCAHNGHAPRGCEGKVSDPL